MASSFKSVKDLKAMVWKSREEALADLKRNGFPPTGSDYVLGEHTPGSKVWQLLDRTDDDGAQAPPEAPTKAAKPGKAKPDHPGDADMRAKAAKAVGYEIHFRVSPTKVVNEQADTLEAARKVAERLNAAHGKHGRRAMIYAKQAKGPSIPIVGDDPPVTKVAEKAKGTKKPAQAKADPPAEAKPEPAQGNDMTPLPMADGPYGIRVAEDIAQARLAQTALEWSRKIGFLVAITDKTGKVVRTIDGRLGGKAPTRTATRAAQRSPRAPQGEGKMARAIRLLMREEGAKAAEIAKATGWDVGQRHINKASRDSGTKIETIAEKHWRLVKA